MGARDKWRLVGTVAEAAAESTDWARQLQQVHCHAGLVFVGYGDWNANTGPSSIVSWDGAAFTAEHAFENEANHAFRVVDGQLWALAVDRRSSTVGYCRRGADGTWSDVEVLPASYHVFDVAELGGTIYLAGAGDGGDGIVMVWASTDGGSTWSASLTIEGYPNARAYFIAERHGRVWVHPIADELTPTATAYSNGGDGWQAEQPILTGDQFGSKPLCLPGGQVLLQRVHPAAGGMHTTWLWDAGPVEQLGDVLSTDHCQVAGRTFLLADGPQVVELVGARSGRIATRPIGYELPGAVSLTGQVERGAVVLYAGTDASELWRCEVTVGVGGHPGSPGRQR